MKRKLLLSAVYISSSLLSLASVLPPSVSKVQLQNLVNSLAYPNSSERFFREGQQQLEQEITRLQKDPNMQTVEPLKIDPSISQRQRNLQQPEQSRGTNLAEIEP